MGVKILLDPIYTARPSRCSTVIQYWNFVQYVLQRREDVFFYWLVPDWAQGLDDDWFPDHPNIRYFFVKQSKDRVQEYVKLREDVDDLISFYGQLWDYDILITNRTGLAPLYKMNMYSPRQSARTWMKELWLIEEMPLMTFKGSVAVLNKEVQDLYTLSGYCAADHTVVMSYHEPEGILLAAKQWLSPSTVLELRNKLKPVIPLTLNVREEKKEVFTRELGRPFGLAYVGRLSATSANLDVVYKVMTEHWILRGGENISLMVYTPGGLSVKGNPPPWVKLKQAGREEFWSAVRKDMDVILILHDEAGFLLSMMEPIFLGTPVIVKDAAWSRGQLGEDYPFYVSSEKEAYALSWLFFKDYPSMYELFLQWRENWLFPEYERRFKEDDLYKVLWSYLIDFEEKMEDNKKLMESMKTTLVMDEILNEVWDQQEFVLSTVVRKLKANGVMDTLDKKLNPTFVYNTGLVWGPLWNDYRFLLKAFHGWEDASAITGHFKRVN